MLKKRDHILKKDVREVGGVRLTLFITKFFWELIQGFRRTTLISFKGKNLPHQNLPHKYSTSPYSWDQVSNTLIFGGYI
jgi:hypothetical protein